MKTNIKNILRFIIFIILTSLNAKAQLFQTRSEIIKEKGYNYTTDTTNEGIKYIRYDTEKTTNASGKYTMAKVMYFKTSENGSEICYMWAVMEPSSETNSNVSYYKNKFVEVGYMQWKDYEHNVIYDIESKDGVCVIAAWWDNKK